MTGDDSASIRQMVSFTLGQAGYETVKPFKPEQLVSVVKKVLG